MGLFVDGFLDYGGVKFEYGVENVCSINLDCYVRVFKFVIDNGNKFLLEEVVIEFLVGRWLEVFWDGVYLLDENDGFFFV